MPYLFHKQRQSYLRGLLQIFSQGDGNGDLKTRLKLRPQNKHGFEEPYAIFKTPFKLRGWFVCTANKTSLHFLLLLLLSFVIVICPVEVFSK